jgi:uncharacterized protein (DUF433 family)
MEKRFLNNIIYIYILKDRMEEFKMIDTPAYNFSEVSRYLRIPKATLRSWILGREYPRGDSSAFFKPLILLPDRKIRLLSFNNLVESYVLSSLRHIHKVSIKDVRRALEYAQSEFNISRLLLSRELCAAAGNLFIKRYGELINLSLSGQLALKLAFENYLKRIEWDKELPARLYPYIDVDRGKTIVIDPFIQFGRPILKGKCILTSTIVDRIDAGESPKLIALDYGIELKDVSMAVRYERAA